ncbi:MAG TPA: LuxR C-terminal-related transcriptional regulator [Polyangiaceae bacterium]|nr:LuxR C-terminal-related transcriptional regulator [Polyangiaceae bacterium]
MSQGELLSIERDLASVVEVRDLAGSVLSRMQTMIGASGSTLSYYESGRREVQRKPTLLGGTLPHMMAEYPADLFAEDPIYAWNLALPPSLFIATGENFDMAAFGKSRPCVEFYRPREIGFMCGVRPTGLPYGAQHMFGLMFCKPQLEQRFAAKELDLVRHLEIPLRTAARRIAHFRGLQDRSNLLCELIDRQRGALVLWNLNGRLIWSSSQAQRLLAGAAARTDLEHAATIALRQARRGAAHGDAALLGRPRQLRSGRGTTLTIEFSLLRDAHQHQWLLAEIKAAARGHSALSALTKTETHVLRLLAAGLSNREIADKLVVSCETVKTHVKHILSKLGVSSRGKAASIARGAGQSSPALG